MSEFTDFFALLTEAQTLSDLRGALEQSVEGAYVPLDELPFDALDSPETLQAAWAAHPKPAWIKLGLPWNAERDALAELAQLGPAVNIRVEEDFSSWALIASCNGTSFRAAMLVSEDRYREATDMVPLYDAGADTEALANCLGTDDATFRATMIPDGGESFSAAVGIKYEQMLDMTLEDIGPGEFTFGLGI